jgi:hypothetical protein
MNQYGFDEAQWEAAKTEGKTILSGYAKRQKMVLYSEFVKQLHSVYLESHDVRLFYLLGQISTEEDAAGRGMLSALVVKKDRGLPGTGFFELAHDLGHDTKDILTFWINEVNKVFAAWNR